MSMTLVDKQVAKLEETEPLIKELKSIFYDIHYYDYGLTPRAYQSLMGVLACRLNKGV
jgi:hypothetical protein